MLTLYSQNRDTGDFSKFHHPIFHAHHETQRLVYNSLITRGPHIMRVNVNRVNRAKQHQPCVHILLAGVVPLVVKLIRSFGLISLHVEKWYLFFDKALMEKLAGTSVRGSGLRWQLSTFDTVNCRGSLFPGEAITCQASLMCLLLLERPTCSPLVILERRQECQ